MRGYHPRDVLQVNAPIFKLLCAAPPPEHLVDAVATSLITGTAQSELVRSIAAAGRLLAAVRENIRAPGRVTFLVHFNVSSKHPSCLVVLASGKVSAKLWCRVNVTSGEVEIEPVSEGMKPRLVISRRNLQAERYSGAMLH